MKVYQPKADDPINPDADETDDTGDDLKNFIDNTLFPSLQNLEPAGDDYCGVVIRNVFEDAYNYMKSGQLMRQVIKTPQDEQILQRIVMGVEKTALRPTPPVPSAHGKPPTFS